MSLFVIPKTTPYVRFFIAGVVAFAGVLAGCSHSPSGGSGDAGDMTIVDEGIGLPDLTPVGPDMAKTCGDGVIEKGETCDDGNDKSGDGCSSTCQTEIGWECSMLGMPCQRQVYCGDGYVEPPETCDDGNSKPGDGCSGTCQLEPNYVCSTPTPAPNPTHQVCTSTIICGDGVVELGEQCDDGDTTGMNGCSKDCTTVEPGFTCPPTGGKCAVAKDSCGNGKIDPGEGCDDGNTTSNDGCSSACQVETGWTCKTPDSPCTRVLYCGDGIITFTPNGEQCDDGNMKSGDGCSATCQIENNFSCKGTPSVCTSTIKCGDGVIGGTEMCDDGNTTPGDGCSSMCKLEMGWTCPYVDSPCIASMCGDGIKAGSEQCDTGTSVGVAGSGCSATCTIPAGSGCSMDANNMTSVCAPYTCGNGVLEPGEQCDDGNLIPYDTCSPTCTLPTTCSGGKCTAVCGDGLVFPGEGCDDGNLQDGDGCDSNCNVESGWSCSATTAAAPKTLTIPILYRDMIHVAGTTPTGTTANPDFDNPTITANAGAIVTGLASSTLGSDNKPKWGSDDGNSNPQNAFLIADTSTTTPATDAQVYCWWFHDTGCNGASSKNPYAKLVWLDGVDSKGNPTGNPTTLTLTTPDSKPSASSVYTFASVSFFPLDGLGWNASSTTAQTDVGGADNKSHNFSFSSELHYIFTYTAAGSTMTTGPQFQFSGDDDVLFFINGQLVVDLGGIHGPQNPATTYTLTTTNAKALGLVDQGWYSLDVFQDERHVTGSDYTLSLQGFAHNTSVCTPICGDGKIEVGEACDNGSTDSATKMSCTTPGTPKTCTSNNTGDGTGYGTCSSDCKVRGPYCGDSKITSPETCDNGVNQSVYGTGTNICAPGCKQPPYCGDGTVQTAFDEQCDDGAKNGTNGDKCTSNCTLAAQCGNGVVEGSEQCDDGANNGHPGDDCSSSCTLLCGNGFVDPGEACDNGAKNNTGGYGGCNANCTLGPYCGDGIKTLPEACDNGQNTGAYGTCNKDCTLAPYCGDGITNGSEQCDNGSSNSQNAYGKGQCTTTCQTAPYCGDGIVESSFGEQCDGVSASCNAMCMSISVIN